MRLELSWLIEKEVKRFHRTIFNIVSSNFEVKVSRMQLTPRGGRVEFSIAYWNLGRKTVSVSWVDCLLVW